MTLWWLLACSTSTPTDTATDAPRAPIFVPLDDARLARRVSIDLRARLPTEAELAQAAEPGGIDTLRDQWFADPGFEAHLVDLFAEEWLLRLDTLRVKPTEFGLDPHDGYLFTRSFGDEPARLIAHVVAQDRPYTEIVTADYTLADDVLLSLLPLELEDASDTAAWRVARYTDGRPANGILATSGMWLRFHTTIFNYNRGRAATLGKLLLCYDVAARPVVFQGVTEESTEGLEAAITTDPGCIACHASLDPLASTLFGFWPYEDLDGRELTVYHPEREGLWLDATGTAPAYFGTPLTAAGQLGLMVAADPRFPQCSARRAAERLWGRPTTTADDEVVESLGAALTSRWSYQDLLRAVLATDEYRAGALVDPATDTEREATRPVRVLSPNTLHDLVEDATGFRWTYGGADQLDEDSTGYRALLGGADGEAARVPWLEPSVSRAYAIRRLAQGGAAYVVGNDLAAEPAARRLLPAEPADLAAIDPAGPEFEAAVQSLHRRLHGVTADAETLAGERELYVAILGTEGAESAWSAIVTVLLRDPLFWTY